MEYEMHVEKYMTEGEVDAFLRQPFVVQVFVNTEPCDVRETARLMSMGDAYDYEGVRAMVQFSHVASPQAPPYMHNIEIQNGVMDRWRDVRKNLDDIGCHHLPLAVVLLLHPLQTVQLVFPIMPDALHASGSDEQFPSRVYSRRTMMKLEIANRLK